MNRFRSDDHEQRRIDDAAAAGLEWHDAADQDQTGTFVELYTRVLYGAVLVALREFNHQHYPSATKWFEEGGRNDWGTCALTEAGFAFGL